VTKKVLVTGSAGFIGFHLVKALLENGFDVVGIDSLNDYYDPELKLARLENLNDFVKEQSLSAFYYFEKVDISDDESLKKVFQDNAFNIVINLAAQAGVRYSIENPKAYINSNIVGFANILECCRHAKIENLIYASSSSVYGMNAKQPFNELDRTDFPVSVYAATKKANELLAHSYSHLFGFSCVGLRFFTVYGPFGRPDMAYYSFTAAIDEGRSINIFNDGKMLRDFTYIDDIVEGIVNLLDYRPSRLPNVFSHAESSSQVFNIGNNSPVSLDRFVNAIEKSLGKKAVKNFLPMQPGDVPATYADIDSLSAVSGFRPKTSIEDGIERFVSWYKDNKTKIKGK